MEREPGEEEEGSVQGEVKFGGVLVLPSKPVPLSRSQRRPRLQSPSWNRYLVTTQNPPPTASSGSEIDDRKRFQATRGSVLGSLDPHSARSMIEVSSALGRKWLSVIPFPPALRQHRLRLLSGPARNRTTGSASAGLE
jgi:hypothetical protein